MATAGVASARAVDVLAEAELYTCAEAMLVEVLGRIRESDRDLLLPSLTDPPGPSGQVTLRSVVADYVIDDAGVPGVLDGGMTAAPDRRELRRSLAGPDPQAVVVRVAEAASAAARRASDASLVHPVHGIVSIRKYLLRLTINRSFVAHYVAAYLGSTACPLPEELARPLLELTQPDAAQWRALGIFRAPMPVPPLASWRDRFLLTAGHLPHPLGH